MTKSLVSRDRCAGFRKPTPHWLLFTLSVSVLSPAVGDDCTPAMCCKGRCALPCWHVGRYELLLCLKILYHVEFSPYFNSFNYSIIHSFICSEVFCSGAYRNLCSGLLIILLVRRGEIDNERKEKEVKVQTIIMSLRIKLFS